MLWIVVSPYVVYFDEICLSVDLYFKTLSHLLFWWRLWVILYSSEKVLTLPTIFFVSSLMPVLKIPSSLFEVASADFICSDLWISKGPLMLAATSMFFFLLVRFFSRMALDHFNLLPSLLPAFPPLSPQKKKKKERPTPKAMWAHIPSLSLAFLVDFSDRLAWSEHVWISNCWNVWKD